jgi:hypothetical protein
MKTRTTIIFENRGRGFLSWIVNHEGRLLASSSQPQIAARNYQVMNHGELRIGDRPVVHLPGQREPLKMSKRIFSIARTMESAHDSAQT